MIVIYAEKPDMGEKIAAALGGNTYHPSEKKRGYYHIVFQGKECAVTWGYGHLCTLASASDYNEQYKSWSKMPIPFIPDKYRIVLNKKSPMPVMECYRVVRSLFDKADSIINATDYDREGELIFYFLYSYMGCKKPVFRANMDKTTQSGILNAFTHLMSNQKFANLLESAKCRAMADWVTGCNLTAAMTLRLHNGNVYSIGRVQTPTLAMIVKRDEEIANFIPQDYFVVEACFTTGHDGTYKGIHKAKRFDKKEDAQVVLEKTTGGKGIVSDIVSETKLRSVPELYSLIFLQKDANKKYGFTAQKTLDITQKLYEKGYVTYPRTDSQYLPNDMEQPVMATLDMLKENGFADLFNEDADVGNLIANKNHYFDDSKIGSHYAIIPTESPAKGLSIDESKIYGMIADSVIRMLYPPAEIIKTKVTTEVNGEPFITNGTAIAKQGWMFVHGSTKEEFIPYLEKGNVADAECSLVQKQTEPPKHYTDNTLLTALLTAGKDIEDDNLRKFMMGMPANKQGIGTPATRAALIETLLSRQVIVREKNSIIATGKGISLIHAIPVEAIKSAEMTAQYEWRLNDIVEGKDSPDAFMADINRDVTEWCSMIEKAEIGEMETAKGLSNTSLVCPVCGSPMRKFSWGYGCTEYRNGCKFSIGKIAGKMLTEAQVKTLLSAESIGPLKGFKNKNGDSFSASLKLIEIRDEGKIVDYKISFDFPESLENKMPDIYAVCPNCRGRIVKGKWGWECENKCGLSLPYIMAGREMEPSTAEALFHSGRTGILDGFRSKKKNGRPFNAGLYIDGNKVAFYFPEHA